MRAPDLSESLWGASEGTDLERVQAERSRPDELPDRMARPGRRRVVWPLWVQVAGYAALWLFAGGVFVGLLALMAGGE